MKELAFHFQTSRRTEIHFKELPKHIKQKFPGLRSFRELDYFEADVRTCTFLIRDPAGFYSFVHRSFCEFFVACAVVEHISQGRWPDHLWKGKRYDPAAWLSPETAGFVLEMIDRKKLFEKVLGYFYQAPSNGVLLFILAKLFTHSRNPAHVELSDTIYFLNRRRLLAGMDFRAETVKIASSRYSDAWKKVAGEYESRLKK